MPIRDVRQHMKTVDAGLGLVGEGKREGRGRTVPCGLGLSDVAFQGVVPGQVVVTCRKGSTQVDAG